MSTANPSLAIESLPPRPQRPLAKWGLILLIAVGVLFLWIATRAADTRGIRHLPEEQRRQLFESTRRQVEIECAPGAPQGLHGHCMEAAERLLEFPECDKACAAQTRPLARPAVR